MQAAIGCAQLDKLPGFIHARRNNWQKLKDGLSKLSDTLILPEATANSQPSWFGFLMTVRENAEFSRDQIVDYLESNKIQTRTLFAGNLIKHPCFDEMRNSQKGYRVIGELKNTDMIMNDSFWVGVYPGLHEEAICYIIEKIENFVKTKSKEIQNV